ncbi:MAG: PQQ-binding-like beta-propeller repeat protein [Verrucomicrobia bacterium]|nr:PQQ-binding-like beta-propeller repeat protein [Verrucomicrobiota bacterium]
MKSQPFLVAVALTASVTVAAPSDWPCFRGPNHDGTLAVPFTLTRGEPQVLWRAKLGSGNGSQAVVAGRVFTAANGQKDRVVCLDARTGQRVWSVSDFRADGNSTPSVESNRVYVLGHGRSFPEAACVSAADGKALWTAALPKGGGPDHYGLAGSPRVWRDLVFFNVAGGAAVRKDSGEVAWAHDGHTAYATPVVFDARGRPAVAFFTGDQLIARDARSGRELWTIPWKTELEVNACDPLFVGDRVFVCSAYKRARSFYDVSGASPRLLWESTRNGDGHAYASGFIQGEGIFFFTGGSFARVDMAGGDVLWESRGGNSVLLLGGSLIRVSEKGELTAGPFDPSRKVEPVLRAQVLSGTTRAVPAYWAGQLYVRNEAGDLVCLKISE